MGEKGKYQSLRLTATRGTITVEIGDASFTTSLKYFTKAVERLLDRLSLGVTVSAEILKGMLKSPEISVNSKAVSAIGSKIGGKPLKLYIPSKVARWLEIQHGDTVTLECTRIRGRKIALIKKTGQERCSRE